MPSLFTFLLRFHRLPAYRTRNMENVSIPRCRVYVTVYEPHQQNVQCLNTIDTHSLWFGVFWYDFVTHFPPSYFIGTETIAPVAEKPPWTSKRYVEMYCVNPLWPISQLKRTKHMMLMCVSVSEERAWVLMLFFSINDWSHTPNKQIKTNTCA